MFFNEEQKLNLVITVAITMTTLQPHTTQLEFHQAMSDFKTMFPDMDDEVIEAVLRANQGAVDATIDQLLTMSTDNENEKLRHEIESQETNVAVDQDEPSPIQTGKQPDLVPSERSDIPLRTIHRWIPPLLGPLPDDFLRLTPVASMHKKQFKLNKLNLHWHQYHARRRWLKLEKQRRKTEKAMLLSQQLLQQKYAENQKVRGALSEAADPDIDRYLQDECIALFLQNEEFMADLRFNKEFLSTLEKDQTDDSPPDEMLGSFSLSKSGSHDDEALFRERLRNMGKTSRKKFAHLARMFTRRKKRSSAKTILSQGPAPSHDSLLLSVEPEPLLDDEENDDFERERVSHPHHRD